MDGAKPTAARLIHGVGAAVIRDDREQLSCAVDRVCKAAMDERGKAERFVIGPIEPVGPHLPLNVEQHDECGQRCGEHQQQQAR